MPTLYQLSEDIKYILDLADEDEDEQSLREALENLSGECEDKAESIATLVQELTALSVSRDAEAKRLINRAKVALNAARRAKEYLRENMKMCGMRSLDTNRFRITRCKNSGKSPIDLIEDKVPESYKNETVISKIDTERIREELELGTDLEFAKLADRGEHLRIK